MKIKIKETIKGIDGITILKNPDGSDMTLKDVIIASLLPPVQEDKQDVKWGKYEIFKKVRDGKAEVELKTEEITIIKQAIGKFQPPLILGQCFEFIEDGNS